MPERWIRMRSLRAKLDDRSRSSIYRDMARGRLPKPVKQGNVNLWNDREVDEALLEQRALAEQRPPLAQTLPNAE